MILDVGSGHRPFEKADVLCDLYYHISTDQRPFIFSDIHFLPFKKGSFDFVVCRNTLEHVRDPAAAFRELKRVGKSGFVDVPSVLYESIYGWEAHKHMFIKRGKSVYFIKAKKPPWGSIFKSMYERSRLYKLVHNTLLFLGILDIKYYFGQGREIMNRLKARRLKRIERIQRY